MRLPVCFLLALLATITVNMDCAGAWPQFGYCTSILPSYSAMLYCYPPSRVMQAESLVAFRPVTPVTVVTHRTQLHLTQVLLPTRVQLDEPPDGSNPKRSIFYIFGGFARDQRGEPDPTSSSPRYLVVSEVLGEIPPSHSTVKRALDLFGPFAVNRAGRSPWEFDAHLPRSGVQVSLHIAGNLPRVVITDIGARILRLAAGH